MTAQTASASRAASLPARRSLMLLLGLILAAAAGTGAAALSGRGGSHVVAPSINRPPGWTGVGLPLAAQGPVSAALGRDDRAYWVHGSHATNAAEHLRIGFAASGVTVADGGGRLGLSLTGFGRVGAVRPVDSAVPSIRANRVVYDRGTLTESYANGPIGLEQGFDLARAPAGGAGRLLFSISLAGNLRGRLTHGEVVFSGHGIELGYSGLLATDATGRQLPASITLHGRRVVLSVDDRSARYPLRVDPIVQEAILNPTDAGATGVGYSVAVSGGTAVVGAPDATEGGATQAGAVYVFTEPATGWANAAQTATLTNSSPVADTELGDAVAIDGGTIVAGSVIPDFLGAQGSVDVFTEQGGSWKSATQTAVLTDGTTGTPGGDTGGDDLGASVAIAGTTIAAGAPGIEGVQVFTEPGPSWTNMTAPTATLTATNSAGSLGNNLGVSVAISADGTTIVAGADAQGASSAPPGAAYVFVEPTTGGWKSATQTSELTASDAGGQLGASVGIDGNTIVAGAPFYDDNGQAEQGAAYVFVEPASGGWPATETETARLTASDGAVGDQFGFSVSISDGTIAVGAVTDKVAGMAVGAVYLYSEPAGGWTTSSSQSSELGASDAATGSGFGYSVSISDGTIAVGAPRHTVETHVREGEAYVFGTPGSTGAGGGGGPTAPPVNTARPVLTGTPAAKKTVACSTGAWTNTPTAYAYRWSRDGTPIQGATLASYVVESSDEGLTLTCTVTASNSKGAGTPATSTGVAVPVPHVAKCPAATGKLDGTTLGLVKLGMTRAAARTAYTRSSNRGKKYEDFFCLTPIGVRVGYATSKESKKLSGHVIWASTSSAYYAINGIRVGATVAATTKKLKLSGPYKVGLNTWYFTASGASNGIFKVRGGLIEEIGIANKTLTNTTKAKKTFLKSFS